MTTPAPFDTLRWEACFPLLRLDGSGTRDFLQGQTSADLKNAGNTLIHSCWLNATGRLQALLEIRLDEQGADLLVLAGDANSVATGLDRVIFPADRVRLSTAGEQRRLQALRSNGEVIWIEPDETLDADWQKLQRADERQLEHWRMLRGWPSAPGELSGDTNPFELGLSPWVSLSKGCYLGQETMAKLASSGGVKQQLRSWSSDTALVSGDTLTNGEQRAGVVTSVLDIKPEESWVGLALIRRQHLDADRLSGPQGQQLTLDTPHGFEPPPQPSTT